MLQEEQQINDFFFTTQRSFLKHLDHEDNKTNITVKYGVTMLGIKKYIKYNLFQLKVK